MGTSSINKPPVISGLFVCRGLRVIGVCRITDDGLGEFLASNERNTYLKS